MAVSDGCMGSLGSITSGDSKVHRFGQTGSLGFDYHGPRSIPVPAWSLLQDNARGSLEAIRMVETNDASLASLISICDKLAARGNPTLVDLDFENALLTMPELGVLGALSFARTYRPVGRKLAVTSIVLTIDCVRGSWDWCGCHIR